MPPPPFSPPLLSGESRTRGLGKAQQNETRGSSPVAKGYGGTGRYATKKNPFFASSFAIAMEDGLATKGRPGNSIMQL